MVGEIILYQAEVGATVAQLHARNGRAKALERLFNKPVKGKGGTK